MAVGQDILNRMELLHPEMQLQPLEVDVVKGVLAMNISQDYFESVLAMYPQAYGDSVGTVTTTPGSETTPFPLDLLRLDALWRLNDLGVPIYPVDIAQMAGGHVLGRTWPESLATQSSGAPTTVFVNGRSFYWTPVPEAAYDFRWYGLQAQPDLTALSTFMYPDVVLTPLATLAAKVYRVGLDDSAAQLTQLANDLFTPVLQILSGFRRDAPKTLTYSRVHSA